jgi:hypothetical protein
MPATSIGGLMTILLSTWLDSTRPLAVHGTTSASAVESRRASSGGSASERR